MVHFALLDVNDADKYSHHKTCCVLSTTHISHVLHITFAMRDQGETIHGIISLTDAISSSWVIRHTHTHIYIHHNQNFAEYKIDWGKTI